MTYRDPLLTAIGDKIKKSKLTHEVNRRISVVDLVYEQGSGDINEDNYCRNENLFGVFDGATSLTSTRFENHLTGGYLAANLAALNFKANNGSLTSLAKRANTAIYEAMVGHRVDLLDKRERWCSSAAVVRLFEDHFEWVQIGDSLILAIHEDGRHELLIDDFEHDLETLQMWKDSDPGANDTIFTSVFDQIVKTRAKQNVTYGVLNGEEAAFAFLKTGEKDLHGVKHLLLFTDGLFIPNSQPEKRVDFTLFTRLFLEGGLARVRDTVREMERSDVECRRFPRFKVHDDIAAYAITFDPAF